MNKKTCIITGITGQDGSFLTEFLLNRDYEIHGLIRRSSSFNTGRIDHLFNHPKLKLHFFDLTDQSSINSLMSTIKPDEIYHLGAQSHVKVSFELPHYTTDANAIGTLNLLEAMRVNSPWSRFYNACTSELFGGSLENPQSETTQFYPKSPYAISKLYSYWITKNYRESYNLFATNGILFNHESERRGETFVTRKITIGLSKLANNYQIVNNLNQVIPAVSLGNIYAKRDWGYAPDYVYGMWLMLQYDNPDDFILATGETHSIKEFINEAILHTPFSGYTKWVNEGGEDEKLLYKDKIELIKIDKRYYRPSDVECLIGNYQKAKSLLEWYPTTTFKELVRKMMKFDLEN